MKKRLRTFGILIGLAVILALLFSVFSSDTLYNKLTGKVISSTQCSDGTNLGQIEIGTGSARWMCTDYTGVRENLDCYGGDNNSHLNVETNGWKCGRWGWECGGQGYNSGYCCNEVHQNEKCPTTFTKTCENYYGSGWWPSYLPAYDNSLLIACDSVSATCPNVNDATFNGKCYSSSTYKSDFHRTVQKNIRFTDGNDKISLTYNVDGYPNSVYYGKWIDCDTEINHCAACDNVALWTDDLNKKLDTSNNVGGIPNCVGSQCWTKSGETTSFGEYKNQVQSGCCGDDANEYFVDGICCNSPTDINQGGKCVTKTTTSVNGICGSSNGQSFSVTPTTNLCSQGTASDVIINPNKYNWNCAGSNNVATLCSATRTTPATSSCGDLTCAGTETCSTCPGDCGACTQDNTPSITSVQTGEINSNQNAPTEQKNIISEGLFLSNRNWKSCMQDSEGVSAQYEEGWIWKSQKITTLKNCADEVTCTEYYCNQQQQPAYREYSCNKRGLENRCIGENIVKLENAEGKIKDNQEVGNILVKLEIKDGPFSSLLQDEYYHSQTNDYDFSKSKIFNIVLEVRDSTSKQRYNIPSESITFYGHSNKKGFNFELYNDGKHNDQNTNDNVYGGVLDMNNFPEGVYAFYGFIRQNDRDYHSFSLHTAPKIILIDSSKEFDRTKETTIGSACEPILFNGDSKENLDIVFVGDKYYDLNELKTDMNSFAAEMVFNVPTFNAYKDRINLWRVNSLNDLECRHEEDCISGLFKPLFQGKLEGVICCNANKAKDLANLCPNDFAVVIEKSDEDLGTVGLNTENPLIWIWSSQSRFNPFSYIRIPLYGDLGKTIGAAFVTSATDGETVAHELGHLISRLPDYYESDPKCEQHKCMMCSSGYDFGNKDLCIDRARMVEQLNQFCDAKVSIIPKNPTSPYPNPYNPTKCTIKSESNLYSGKCTQKVKYKVEYPNGGEPCYILMHVYDVKGAEIKALVSDVSQGAGEYILEWDGTNNDGVPVASGTYFFVVDGGRDSTSKTLKGTLIK